MRKYRLKSSSIGVIKEFDNLCRLVIPKEMRDLYKFGKEVLYQYQKVYLYAILNIAW